MTSLRQTGVSLPCFISTSVRQRRVILGKHAGLRRFFQAFIRQELHAMKPSSSAANRTCSEPGAAQRGQEGYRADAIRLA